MESEEETERRKTRIYSKLPEFTSPIHDVNTEREGCGRAQAMSSSPSSKRQGSNGTVLSPRALRAPGGLTGEGKIYPQV